MGSHIARAVLELGLNRENVLFRNFPDEKRRSAAVKTFWCAVVLDRDCGFGSGLPMHLRDCDIDASLPEPVSDVLSYQSISFERRSAKELERAGIVA